MKNPHHSFSFFFYSHFFVVAVVFWRGGQEIEFQEIETGERNYCLQNCSGDRKGSRGPKGSLFHGLALT
jgi:hypothetical protein